MAKKGISKIKGPEEIHLGETVYYEVSRLYDLSDTEKIGITNWKIYVRDKGSFRELRQKPGTPPKKGYKIPLTINNQKLVGKEILIEAYLYEPEKYAPPGLKVKVLPGKNKKIDRVELFMRDDTPIKENTVLKYGQSIKVKVYTQNMPGEKMKLSLYEDDVNGSGHSARNEKNKVASIARNLNKDGFLWHEFKLPVEFSKIANAVMDGSHDKIHEYYVVAETAQHKSVSKNAEVKNPDYIFTQTLSSSVDPNKIYGKEILIEEVVMKGKYKKQVGVDAMEKSGRSMVGVSEHKTIINNCGEKYCIKKGDKSELIREINIRLAGFGGNVPTDEFTDRTEKMIKQFQRHYMKVPETGKVCGNVLRAIDEFSNRYPININEAKCPCKECTGFGNGLFPEQKNNVKILEKNRRYEYPGIHRSLLWVEKAIKFYLANHEKHLNLIVGLIFSGYRCNANNKKNGRKSTNHMGKALDLHIYKVNNKINTENNADKVRDILLKYINAEYRWDGYNTFALEPSTRNRIGNEFVATTWVHYDVRTFDLKYLKDEYFVKDNNGLYGESIVALANKLGYQNLCSCYIGTINSNKIEEKTFSTESRVDPKTLKASEKIVEFIKDWEKYSKMPYNDNKGYCTIGYGHLIKKKRCEDIVIPAEFKNGLSEKEATTIFKEDLKEFEIAIQRDVTVKLYQREFDALIDLLFNCGPNFLRNGKAPKLYDNLLNEKYEDAAKEFLDIENKKRRQQNYEIFINGNYDSTH